MGAMAPYERIKHSLYRRAIGYTYTSEKFFLDPRTGKVIRVPFQVHVPPDTKAIIYLLKNRDLRIGEFAVPEITAEMTPREAAELFKASLRAG